ncbi:MAG: zinc ribbon domain-containing protein [Bacteroidales bacterium]|nr:zinc ribbon domain-containing protein [Candidatus Physcousia equi]
MKLLLRLFSYISPIFLLASCFYSHKTSLLSRDDASTDSLTQTLLSEVNYAPGYNFVVRADTLRLCTEIPARASQFTNVPDTICVYRNNEIVVADIAIVPEDSVDAVWVKVARDQMTQGWQRESDLLPCVSPDDPISMAIDMFSGQHINLTVLLVLFVMAVVVIHRRCKQNSLRTTLVTVRNRIPQSPYPIFLSVTMAGSAVFYTSIQIFTPQTWENFYFHPTLNPFAVPPLLGAFLFSLWTMVLFLFASVDDAFRQLSFLRASFFLLFQCTVLAVLYLFFSLTTMIYIGYPLFILFAVLAFSFYSRHLRASFRCGYCGALLRSKGVCPHCGKTNQ